MQNNFLTISVVINCFLTIIAGVLFGTDRTRKVNFIPAVLILTLSTSYYCLYFEALNVFWMAVSDVLQASTSIATILLVEYQRKKIAGKEKLR